MDFSEVIGQGEMKSRLQRLADEDRLPHALMLCGPAGVGKMALAIALASYVLNKGTYKVRGILHPDLHFSFPTVKLAKWKSDYKPVSDDFAAEWQQMTSDGPYFSLTDWLQAMKAENQQAVITVGEANDLIKRLYMKSNQGGWKVSIVWLPERMNGECANKMLKLIEEPPAKTLFILVSQEPERLLETIRSRVQRFDVKPITMPDMTEALKERRALSDDDARRIARIAAGSWLAARDELNAGSERQLFFDLFVTLMRKAYMRDVKDLKRWSENVSAMGREEQKRMLVFFLRMVREAFVYNFHRTELQYMTQDEEAFCVKFARFVNERNVLGFQELFQTALRDVGQNTNSSMVFFDITMTVAVLLHQTRKNN
jgi:DNA polymerase-3 subunit delta'